MPECRSRSGRSTAAVDVSIPPSLTAGDTGHATVELAGGLRDRHIDRLSVRLRTDVETPDGRQPATIAERPLGEAVTVHATDRRTVDVPLAIPRSTPVTIGGTQVWAEVSGDRGLSIHPRTSGPLSISPGERMAHLLDAVSSLGFFLVEATPVAGPTRPTSESAGDDDDSRAAARDGTVNAISQQFRFRPEWGPFEGIGDLYLVTANHGPDTLSVRVTVDDSADSRTAVGTGTTAPGHDRRLRIGKTNSRTVTDDLERLVAGVA